MFNVNNRLLGVLIVKARVTFDFEHSVLVISMINARGDIKVTRPVSFYYKCILTLKHSYFTYIPDEELKSLFWHASVAIIIIF